jgi:hypothetical protein
MNVKQLELLVFYQTVAPKVADATLQQILNEEVAATLKGRSLEVFNNEVLAASGDNSLLAKSIGTEPRNLAIQCQGILKQQPSDDQVLQLVKSTQASI